jgi:hypothetical protein
LVNYNKTRINIGHQLDRWMELKEALKLHQCHCACSSENGTCIINDACRQAPHKNKENARFLVESRQTTFYTHLYNKKNI